uniref:BED-type domain-containing protein n=1 Tax=Chenopodium quinoa TaxID=63459 RepID=A0A803LP37_CHEQI
MESEATTTSMPVADEVDESNTARKRKRSRKSKFWREMTEGKNSKGERIAICKYCKMELIAHNNSGTSHLIRHLLDVCKKRTSGLPLGEAIEDDEEFVFDMSELRKEILLYVVEDDKVLSLTVDNASYNDVMVKHMKNRLGSRDKIRNLVKFVTRSSSRSKDFYDTAQKHFHLEAKRKLRMDMQIYGSDEAMCKVEKVLNTLRSLYNEYKSTFSNSPIVAPSTTSSRIQDENFFDGYQSYSLRITRTQTKKSQLESYLEESELDLNMELDILEYWQQNVVRFPELAILARDLLTIPVSTVASESSFSVGGKTISSNRSSLKPSTVQALVCVQDWRRDEYNIPSNLDRYFNNHEATVSAQDAWEDS